MNWLLSADTKKYDHKGAFDRFGFIDWIQRGECNNGDYVFIYMKQPEGIIRYKTKVRKTNMKPDETISDNEFWHGDLPDRSRERFFRLERIQTLDTTELNVQALREHGLNNFPQGSSRIPLEGAILDYIASCFDANYQEKDRSEFKQYCEANGVAGRGSAQSYVTGLNAIERSFDVDADEQYAIDECASLLSRLDELKQIVSSDQKSRYKDLYSHLIKYVDYKRNTSEQQIDSIGVDYSYNMAKHNGINKVFYGTPGCGKSYYVENEILKKHEQIDDEECIIRTTFFQDYTYTDFVGQLVPSVINEKDVTYKFVPGPFTLAMLRAINNPNKKVALIIEELNRGNAPSIFGDIFQLLDRENGKSRYSIVNTPITDYLKLETKKYFNLDKIRIPNNLYIFATMNTSDQNVFTLDTAFKRRWEFEKISNEFDDSDEYDIRLANMFVPCLPNTKWKQFVKGINEYILTNIKALSAEDKQIGKYFVDDNLLLDEHEEYAKEKALRFAFKVYEYIWSDVAKYNRDKWFASDIKSFDDVIKKVKKKDEGVFVPELMKAFTNSDNNE